MNLPLLAFTVRPLSIARTTISSTCRGRLKLQNRGTGKIEFDVWACPMAASQPLDKRRLLGGKPQNPLMAEDMRSVKR